MTKNSGIEILEFHSIEGNGPLKAFASVQVENWVFYDWRIIQQPGHRAYVSVSQTSWRDRNGKVRYRALLSIPGELKQQIEVAILSAWEKEKKKVGSSVKPNL